MCDACAIDVCCVAQGSIRVLGCLYLSSYSSFGKRFSNATEDCRVCPIGQYRQELSELYKCTPCPVNTYNGYDDSPKNQESHDALSDCAACPTGQLTDGELGAAGRRAPPRQLA